jgi:hypothetical protein
MPAIVERRIQFIEFIVGVRAYFDNHPLVAEHDDFRIVWVNLILSPSF